MLLWLILGLLIWVFRKPLKKVLGPIYKKMVKGLMDLGLSRKAAKAIIIAGVGLLIVLII